MVSRTASPIPRSSAVLASGSASATSISVRMIASGVRSSCEAWATKWRWLANAPSRRPSMPSKVSASSRSSSAGPCRSIRSPRFSPDTRRAVAVISRSGRSARPASSQPVTTATTVIATSATSVLQHQATERIGDDLALHVVSDLHLRGPGREPQRPAEEPVAGGALSPYR